MASNRIRSPEHPNHGDRQSGGPTERRYDKIMHTGGPFVYRFRDTDDTENSASVEESYWGHGAGHGQPHRGGSN